MLIHNQFSFSFFNNHEYIHAYVHMINNVRFKKYTYAKKVTKKVTTCVKSSNKFEKAERASFFLFKAEIIR